jgi:hypothetical protein
MVISSVAPLSLIDSYLLSSTANADWPFSSVRTWSYWMLNCLDSTALYQYCNIVINVLYLSIRLFVLLTILAQVVSYATHLILEDSSVK